MSKYSDQFRVHLETACDSVELQRYKGGRYSCSFIVVDGKLDISEKVSRRMVEKRAAYVADILLAEDADWTRFFRYASL